MASRALHGGSRVGWVSGAVLVFTGALTACEDKDGSTAFDGGADAATGYLSGESRALIDAGPNDGTQGLGVTLEETTEHADTLTVGLGELSDEVDASAPTSSSAPATSTVDVSSPATTEAVTSSEPVVTSGVPTEAPTSETPDETSSAVIDSTTAIAVPSSEPVETSATPTTSAEVPTTSDAPTTSAEVPTTSDAPTTSAEVPTTSDAPTTSDETSSSGEVIIITSETPDAGTSSSDTSSSSEPPIIGGEVVGSADWVDLPAAFQIVGLPEGNFEYLWSIVQVPDGSAVTNDALNGRTEPQLTFVPDFAGQYTVQITVLIGDTQVVRYGSINVAKVDVGFLEMSAGVIDGGYFYTPMMVPSDQSNEPFQVGCGYDSTDFRDFSWWLDAIWRETGTIGFSYPEVPSDETLFAYAFREAANSPGVTRVATAESVCDDDGRGNLSWGRYPDFSPSESLLARIDDWDGARLLVSPLTSDDTVVVDSIYAGSSDWWDESSLIWTGRDCSERCAGVVGLSKPGEQGYTPVLDCRTVPEPIFGVFGRIVALEGALLVEADTRLWYIPLHDGGNGLPYASCEDGVTDAYIIANNLRDFALAPDGKTLALIGEFNGDYPSSYLAIGPADVPLSDFSPPWQYTELSMGAYYTGLHWIADSKQVVWTEINLRYDSSDGIYWYELGGSRVNKINSDFTYPRTLAEVAVPEYYSATSVVTTGHIDVDFDYQGGNF